MDATWDRIEAWLAANAPGVLASLNPPATDADIAATEALVGRALPDDVRAAYRRHDGQADDGGLFGASDWLPLARVRDEWSEWKAATDNGDFAGLTNDTDGRVISRDWWHSGWVPLALSGGGDSYCVDLAPGSDGTVGQVIEMIHDASDRPVLAASFSDWLDDFAEELEAGVYSVCGEYGWLVHRRDL